MGNLAQLSAIKTRIGIPASDTADDSILTNFIKSVSGAFERHCNRRFDRAAGATYEFDAQKTEIIPERYPIEAVTAWDLKTDETTGWVAQTVTDYLIRQGCVISLPAALGVEGELGRITYTAGYVLPGTTPGAGQTALPDEVREACVEQVVYLYQNRKRLGVSSVSGQGGSIAKDAQSVVNPLPFLPQVMQALHQYERMLL